MEIAVIAIGLVVLFLAAKFVGWVIKVVGYLFIPLLVTTVVFVLLPHGWSHGAYALVSGVVFLVCLLAKSGK
jgi:hypothetical protein